MISFNIVFFRMEFDSKSMKISVIYTTLFILALANIIVSSNISGEVNLNLDHIDENLEKFNSYVDELSAVADENMEKELQACRLAFNFSFIFAAFALFGLLMVLAFSCARWKELTEINKRPISANQINQIVVKPGDFDNIHGTNFMMKMGSSAELTPITLGGK